MFLLRMLLVILLILVVFEDFVLRGLNEREVGVNDKKLFLIVFGKDRNKEIIVFEDIKDEVEVDVIVN